MIAYLKNQVLSKYYNFSFFYYFSKILSSWPVIVSLSIGFIVVEYQAFVFFQQLTGQSFSFYKISNFAYFIAYTFICYFLFPYLILLLLRENIAYFGLRLPINKNIAIILCIACYLLVIPVFYYFSTRPEFIRSYSEPVNIYHFILNQAVILPLYYIPEEFLFRGFLFMSLWRKVHWHSFWMTELIYTVAHIGKPFFEIIAAFPVGILLNLLTLRTKSIYPAIIVHSAIGISFNIMIRCHS